MNQIKKREFYVNCCCCWSSIFMVCLGILTINVGMSVSDCNYLLDFYRSLTELSEVGCHQLCWGRSIEAEDRLSCCNENGIVCNEKSECLSRLIKNLEHKSTTNNQALVALTVSIGLLIPLSLYFCRKQGKIIQNLQHISPPTKHSDESGTTSNERADLLKSVISTKSDRGRDKSDLFKSFLHDDLESNCCICLDTFQNEKAIRLKCRHLFHSGCIREWSTVRNTCPICRSI